MALTVALIVATVLAFAPLLSAMVGSVLAQAYNCETFDTGVRNCSGSGARMEDAIGLLMGMGWFMLLTFPLMALTPILWLVWLFFAWRGRRRGVS